MFLLDANVVSELRRAKPHGAVVAWLTRRDERELHLSAVTLGEIQTGIELTRRQDAAKADELERWLDDVAATYNVLAMDAACFRECARLMHGRTDDLFEDAMIAATASVHNLVVATRNVRDFTSFRVETVNPFRG